MSPFYRAFLGLSLARLGQLQPAPADNARPRQLRALWISRGKGHGGAYGSRVARRCLNEEAIQAAAQKAAAHDEARGEVAVHLRPVELADVPFAQQLPLFRSAAILTGMHGAGCAPPRAPSMAAPRLTPFRPPSAVWADANLIFLKPGSVVAELCPLGYCTNSYERISPLVGLSYVRWTNSIQSNAKANYDTIVDEEQFLTLMRRAVKLWRAE